MTGINKSAGVENRHSFWCDEHQQRRFYRTCLCLKDAYDAGRLNPDEAGQDCAQAMSRGNCNAYKMREEELTASKSIYFTDVIVIEASSKDVDKGSDSYQRGWAQVGASLGRGDKIAKNVERRITPPPKIASVKKDEGLFAGGIVDMGKIITNEVKREKQKSELSEMKKEIARLCKTDIKAARELLVKAKKLEQLMAA
jgi:hypothetical protein